MIQVNGYYLHMDMVMDMDVELNEELEISVNGFEIEPNR